jgi:pyruvate kinase
MRPRNATYHPDALASRISPSDDPRALLAAVEALRFDVIDEATALIDRWRPWIRRDSFLPCAANLASYLALRRRDLTAYQTRLASWGLSSLGRSEGRVMPNLDAVTCTLRAICGEDGAVPIVRPSSAETLRGYRALIDETDQIFGLPVQQRTTRVMVTLPTQAATDGALARTLVRAGVDCVRINCAHDDPDIWAAMIGLLRAAECQAGRPHRIRVSMDLGGPKVRTIRPDPKRAEVERLSEGDRLLLYADPDRPVASEYPLVGCSLAGVVDSLRPGHRVLINDGKIAAEVVEVRPGVGAVIQIRKASRKGSRIQGGKGLNFPDSDLHVSPLSAKDLDDLDFVLRHADLVAYSFVQSADDVELLLEAIGELLPSGRRRPALLMKIETQRAVCNLPEIIVRAAGSASTAVMLARGDLAVELGYRRLADIQEELLWLCEAASVPLVWATEVLDQLMTKGLPTRAEVTDVVLAERAECVMLNKGPYLAEALDLLDDVLLRMEGHQYKKTPLLRALRSWQYLFDLDHSGASASAPSVAGRPG